MEKENPPKHEEFDLFKELEWLSKLATSENIKFIERISNLPPEHETEPVQKNAIEKNESSETPNS